MPVTVKRIGKKFRVVEAETGRVAKTRLGHAIDGGGHVSRIKAYAQSGHVNDAWKDKQGGVGLRAKRVNG